MPYAHEQLISHRRSSLIPVIIPKPEVPQKKAYTEPVPLSVTKEFIERSRKDGWRFAEKYIIMELEYSKVEATLDFYRQTIPDGPMGAKRKLCNVLRKEHRISILDR